MYFKQFADANEAYPELIRDIRETGLLWTPRYKLCKELRPAVIEISDARNGIFGGHSRQLNYRFLAVEWLSYLAGWGGKKHAELLTAVNRNMHPFVNKDTGEFDGAYGPRLAKSLPDIVELLKRDYSTRQAVAAIWSPGWPPQGVPEDSPDIPCTMSLQFFGDECNDATLALLVNMRSNDINWGWPYDVAAFCCLQCAVADVLGWKVGRYIHITGSLHEYAETPVKLNLYDDTYSDIHIPHHSYKSLTSLVVAADEILHAIYNFKCINHQNWLDFRLWSNDPYWKFWENSIRGTFI